VLQAILVSVSRYFFDTSFNISNAGGISFDISLLVVLFWLRAIQGIFFRTYLYQQFDYTLSLTRNCLITFVDTSALLRGPWAVSHLTYRYQGFSESVSLQEIFGGLFYISSLLTSSVTVSKFLTRSRLKTFVNTRSLIQVALAVSSKVSLLVFFWFSVLARNFGSLFYISSLITHSPTILQYLTRSSLKTFVETSALTQVASTVYLTYRY
jgi:hypothetical protein